MCNTPFSAVYRFDRIVMCTITIFSHEYCTQCTYNYTCAHCLMRRHTLICRQHHVCFYCTTYNIPFNAADCTRAVWRNNPCKVCACVCVRARVCVRVYAYMRVYARVSAYKCVCERKTNKKGIYISNKKGKRGKKREKAGSDITEHVLWARAARHCFNKAKLNKMHILCCCVPVIRKKEYDGPKTVIRVAIFISEKFICIYLFVSLACVTLLADYLRV